MPLKKTFSKDGKKCNVTFSVSPEAATNVSKINLVGDFNSWSSTDTPLKKAKDGSFSVKVELDTNREYQFRYLLDGTRWENDWKADKYIPAPYSNADNSVVVTKKDF
ncbi:MAG: isoamylase early set domain-containing protein [Treponema sp.]|nr:isoamylase early set domain-containing protein [Treponema sp.]